MPAMKASAVTNRISPTPSLLQVKYEYLVAGVSGGVTSTLILHPLDLLKIRFSVNDGHSTQRPQYKGLGSAFVSIFKQEGVRGLYRGVTPNLWGAGSAWGFYFLFYNSIKLNMQGGNPQLDVGPLFHMLAAAEAGVLTLIMTNPIWVVKTRLCLQYSAEDIASQAPSKRYSGMIDALLKTYKYEGVKGLYKGFVPGIFGVSHGALQFMTYEEMKSQYNQYRKVPVNAKLGTLEYLTFAALSKLIAATVTYPYQVVRARLQDHHSSYQGVSDVIRKTWRFEGVQGFYKGLVPNLLRVTPATAITFVVFENMVNFLLPESKVGVDNKSAVKM